MSPADRSAHWRTYCKTMAIVLGFAIGGPMVFHFVMAITRAWQ